MYLRRLGAEHLSAAVIISAGTRSFLTRPRVCLKDSSRGLFSNGKRYVKLVPKICTGTLEDAVRRCPKGVVSRLSAVDDLSLVDIDLTGAQGQASGALRSGKKERLTSEVKSDTLRRQVQRSRTPLAQREEPELIMMRTIY